MLRCPEPTSGTSPPPHLARPATLGTSSSTTTSMQESTVITAAVRLAGLLGLLGEPTQARPGRRPLARRQAQCVNQLLQAVHPRYMVVAAQRIRQLQVAALRVQLGRGDRWIMRLELRPGWGSWLCAQGLVLTSVGGLSLDDFPPSCTSSTHRPFTHFHTSSCC